MITSRGFIEYNPHSTLSQMSLREPPPVPLRASYGLMGAAGVFINMIFFIINIVSDCVLAYVLWQQAEFAPETHELLTWFIIALSIIIIPTILTNILSLVWYYENKQCLADTCVLQKMTKWQTAVRIIMHLLLLGQIIRYVDIVRYGTKMKRQTRRVETGEYGSSVLRRSPKGELYAALQRVMSRDTAMLDMIHSFLQDAPQLVFQIFLLYHSHSPGINISNEFTSITTTVQVWKVVLGVLGISWSVVWYQDELRRVVSDWDQPLNCCGITTCVIWRVAMVSSRIIAIGSFTAIHPVDDVHADHHTIFTIYMREDGTVYIPFTIISTCVLLAHWLIMTAWIHAQGTNFCSRDDNTKRPVLELLYNCVMGVVHIFSYINIKEAPSRRRMAFYYILCLVESTTMISVWCVEMESQYTGVWFRATIVFSVEMLWLLSMCCIVGYYAFLHPDKDNNGGGGNDKTQTSRLQL
ncbi:hypothetical protein Pcinc_020609 [Petrolisthes cinctipes]|uniref:XK-related protein n=1 Tax=Petrolisthes cinctipes TaxID=88211 RepID=A0AAE1FJ37_PETCI|nr:hypothetical protein Pcinc_020609 [Petrolisthes cinctipes]